MNKAYFAGSWLAVLLLWRLARARDSTSAPPQGLSGARYDCRFVLMVRAMLETLPRLSKRPRGGQLVLVWWWLQRCCGDGNRDQWLFVHWRLAVSYYQGAKYGVRLLLQKVPGCGDTRDMGAWKALEPQLQGAFNLPSWCTTRLGI